METRLETCRLRLAPGRSSPNAWPSSTRLDRTSTARDVPLSTASGSIEPLAGAEERCFTPASGRTATSLCATVSAHARCVERGRETAIAGGACRCRHVAGGARGRGGWSSARALEAGCRRGARSGRAGSFECPGKHRQGVRTMYELAREVWQLALALRDPINACLIRDVLVGPDRERYEPGIASLADGGPAASETWWPSCSPARRGAMVDGACSPYVRYVAGPCQPQ